MNPRRIDSRSSPACATAGVWHGALSPTKTCSRSRRLKVFTFNMEGLGRDQPVAVDAVVAEVIDVKDRVDPDAHFHQRLVVGSDIHQKNLLVARRVLRPWR